MAAKTARNIWIHAQRLKPRTEEVAAPLKFAGAGVALSPWAADWAPRYRLVWRGSGVETVTGNNSSGMLVE